METIRNYLETMFLKLPNTPEVYKAKNELWQMMEDKYTELKEEGKSENEAVGIVISEFGNLDELANDLGISQFVESQPMPQGKTLSLDQAKSYLADAGKSAYRTALGVMLCVLPSVARSFSMLLLHFIRKKKIFWMHVACPLCSYSLALLLDYSSIPVYR